MSRMEDFMNDIRCRYLLFIIVTFMKDTDFMNDIRSRYMAFIIVTYIVALEDFMNDKCYE